MRSSYESRHQGGCRSPGISRRQPVTPPSRRGLYLAADTDRLTLLVWDASPDLPAHRPHDDDAVSGRGLEIIGALADRWGSWGPVAGGKVVWAWFDLDR